MYSEVMLKLEMYDRVTGRKGISENGLNKFWTRDVPQPKIAEATKFVAYPDHTDGQPELLSCL